MRDDVAPVVEELVVVLFELGGARLHLDEDAGGPEEVGEFFTALRVGGVGAGEEFELGTAGLFCDAKLKGRAGLNGALVPERAEELIEKGLRLAFLVAFEFGGEVGEVGEALL